MLNDLISAIPNQSLRLRGPCGISVPALLEAYVDFFKNHRPAALDCEKPGSVQD